MKYICELSRTQTPYWEENDGHLDSVSAQEKDFHATLIWNLPRHNLEIHFLFLHISTHSNGENQDVSFLLRKLSFGEKLGRRGALRVVGVAASGSCMDLLNMQPREQSILATKV